tara:strand:+ start:141 stop:602 length:462 start_codon:yes stop_codon:yes gene_type:complete
MIASADRYIQRIPLEAIMLVELVPIELLLSHEEIIAKKVDQLEKMTLRWNAYVLPLVVDRNTGTILDGHHRYTVAKRLNLLCLPCVMVDYLNDDSIELGLWPNSGKDSIEKSDVVNAALSGDLFPPKTSRHRLPDHLPPISIPLSRLMLPAIN